MICKDLENVLREAKKMGCKEVKSFRNIPLENVEIVISALQKLIPQTVIEIESEEHPYTGRCPACGLTLSTGFMDSNYCHWCGQALKEFD